MKEKERLTGMTAMKEKERLTGMTMNELRTVASEMSLPSYAAGQMADWL